jgi:hypothetical protein
MPWFGASDPGRLFAASHEAAHSSTGVADGMFAARNRATAGRSSVDMGLTVSGPDLAVITVRR